MTVALRRKDLLTSSIPFGADSQILSSSTNMPRNRASLGRDSRQGQFDGYPELSSRHSKSGDASSLEGDASPRATHSSYVGPVLPPLHPELSTSVRSQTFFQRRRTLSSDTMTSAGSSVVSIDAGKHGFIIHDDASVTSSLVLAYEQGKDIPPAEYDLPKTILGLDVENIGVGCGVENEEEFHKLPYQIRSRLTLSHINNDEPQPESRRWSNIPDINTISGYGAIEEGLMEIKDRVNSSNYSNYSSPENGSIAANTLCYSTENSPFFGHRGGIEQPYPVPEQLKMPLESTWMSNEHLPGMNKSEEADSNQRYVYLTMVFVMVLFIGIIYGLFSVMKIMA